jgi:hypothetical protein
MLACVLCCAVLCCAVLACLPLAGYSLSLASHRTQPLPHSLAPLPSLPPFHHHQGNTPRRRTLSKPMPRGRCGKRPAAACRWSCPRPRWKMRRGRRREKGWDMRSRGGRPRPRRRRRRLCTHTTHIMAPTTTPRPGLEQEQRGRKGGRGKRARRRHWAATTTITRGRASRWSRPSTRSRPTCRGAWRANERRGKRGGGVREQPSIHPALLDCHLHFIHCHLANNIII